MLPSSDARVSTDEPRGVRCDKTRTTLRQNRLPMAMESLEQRALFSWPNAPFDTPNVQEVIYVNQRGNADLPGEKISSPGAVHGYEVSFDDDGRLSIYTRGSLRIELAFYNGPGQPTRANAARSGNSSIKNLYVGPDKDTLYVAVRAQDPAATGTYALYIRGVGQNVVRPLNRAPKANTFSSRTAVTGVNDTDFFSFTTSVTGTWTISVKPEDNDLNATLNVFDSAGNPVVGTFTRPVDAAGNGGNEIFTLTNVRADTTYYVRVDGLGDSTGFYRVYARGAPVVATKVRRR